MLGGSSVIALVAGLISSKCLAVLLGPAGVGYVGLLQSAVGMGFLIASAGVGVGLIRAGADALARGDQEEVASLRAAMIPLRWVFGVITVISVILLHDHLSQWILGTSRQGTTILIVAVALLFVLAEGIQTSTLNMYHQVSALARVNLWSAALGSGVLVAGAALTGKAGVPVAMVAAAAANWLVGRKYLRQHIPRPGVSPDARRIRLAASGLLRFGLPYTASQLGSTGVQLALPLLVLHTLGAESVGYYRAAMAISVTYLGFLLAAMTQDYYPRLAGTQTDQAKMCANIRDQLRLVTLLALPLITGLLATAPYLVPLVYSARFQPTVDILAWQLIGDVFRFGGYTMSLAILARRGSSLYVLTESVNGIASLFFCWTSLHWFGIQGLGMGFLGANFLWSLVVWMIVRRDLGFRFSKNDGRCMAAILGGLLVVGLMNLLEPVSVRLAVSLSLCALTLGVSGFGLAQEFGGWRRVAPILRARV